VRPLITITLTAADLERERPNLERGAVAGPGVDGLDRGTLCDLELVFPSGERMTVPARAVLATAVASAFAFDGWDRELLGRHLAAPAAGAAADPAEPLELIPIEQVPDEPEAPGDEPPAEEPPGSVPTAHVHERLRGLSVVEQLRVARQGDLSERMVLERLYGKTVWEALLRNSRISVPEVSRLARLGTMPRPLLELILANPAWLQVPQIRRALLSNPRLSQDMVHRVLTLLPRDELQVVPQITAYPAAVRMAAKTMAKR
jgi:hypothetical protein